MHAKDAPLLKSFSEAFPRTNYSLRKPLKLQKLYVKYLVCPRCHRIYKELESECLVRCQMGDNTKCNHVEFPNHPQRVHRRNCGTELMKKVKLGQRYKLVPRKVYVYYNIVNSLQKLVSIPGFLEDCEHWRKRESECPNSWLTDVYDGNLWKEWMKTPDGVPFLAAPGNLLFMLNIDWFQPFEDTQYSIGVIYLAYYLVIQNLPRSARFKPEIIIIVSTITGPKEPSCDDLNPYLDPLVNDLLKLWNGVQMQTPPGSILGSRMIRAALVTRKLCYEKIMRILWNQS